MADFVQTTVNKTALRDLAVPIADVTSFNTIIEGVIADNPFGCVGYTTRDGETIAPIVRNREHYTVKVNFVNETTYKKVGTTSLQSPTIAAFNANASEAMNNTALATAMGGVAERNFAGESYYCQLSATTPRVTTITSPSPGRPSGSRPTRTTRSATWSRPGPTPSPNWAEGGLIPLLSFKRSMIPVEPDQRTITPFLAYLPTIQPVSS